MTAQSVTTLAFVVLIFAVAIGVILAAGLTTQVAQIVRSVLP